MSTNMEQLMDVLKSAITESTNRWGYPPNNGANSRHLAHNVMVATVRRYNYRATTKLVEVPDFSEIEVYIRGNFTVVIFTRGEKFVGFSKRNNADAYNPMVGVARAANRAVREYLEA